MAADSGLILIRELGGQLYVVIQLGPEPVTNSDVSMAAEVYGTHPYGRD